MRGTDKQQRKVRPHQSPAVTAAPLFVTFGDISPRRGENLSLPGEAFMRKIDFRVSLSRRLDKPFSSGYNTEKSPQTVSLQISAAGSGKGTSSWNQKPNNICS